MNKYLITLVALVLSSSLFANEQGYGTRYTTTYERWDREFSNHYDYSETRVVTDVRCDFNTCYEKNRTETVYVEEVVLESGPYSGYQRVRVYNTKRYEDPYVTYYVRDRRIVHREFHHHRHIHTHYTHTEYVYVNFYELDEATALFIAGIQLFDVGTDLLVVCNGDDACEFIALASMVSASALSISASEEAEHQRETELQRKIEESEKASKSQSLQLE